MRPRFSGMLPRCQTADDGKCNRATDRRCASCRRATCRDHLVKVEARASDATLTPGQVLHVEVCWRCARVRGVDARP